MFQNERRKKHIVIKIAAATREDREMGTSLERSPELFSVPAHYLEEHIENSSRGVQGSNYFSGPRSLAAGCVAPFPPSSHPRSEDPPRAHLRRKKTWEG